MAVRNASSRQTTSPPTFTETKGVEAKSESLVSEDNLDQTAEYRHADSMVLNKTIHLANEKKALLKEEIRKLKQVGKANLQDDRSKSRLNTLLIASTMMDQPKFVSDLLALGADVDTRANTKRYFAHTPLMIAAGNGNTKIIQLLIQNGADSSKLSEGNGRWHALLISAYRLHFDAVKYLIDDAHTAVDLPNEYGWTALKLVLEVDSQYLNETEKLEQIKIIQFLVQKGAHPLVECSHDESFAEILAHHKDPVALFYVSGRIVIRAGFSPYKAYKCFCARSDDAAVMASLFVNNQQCKSVE